MPDASWIIIVEPVAMVTVSPDIAMTEAIDAASASTVT